MYGLTHSIDGGNSSPEEWRGLLKVTQHIRAETGTFLISALAATVVINIY